VWALVGIGVAVPGAATPADSNASDLFAAGPRMMRQLDVRPLIPAHDRTVRLRSRAMVATFGGFQYRMSYVAEHIRTPFGRPSSFLDFVIWRTADVRLGKASQSNQYTFQPDKPFSFTWTRGTLESASVNTASTIAPDEMAATFAATADVVDSTCRTEGGGTSHRQRAAGDIAYSAFSINTDATPFFGTLTHGPGRGTLEVDDGCSDAAAPRPRQCHGRQELTAFSDDQLWVFDSRFRGSTRMQGHLDFGNFAASPVRIRFMQSAVPKAAFPAATHTPNGATVRLGAAGNPFMSGGATFRSAERPQRSELISCLSYGKQHRFRVLRYDGRIVPDASPLTADYDTGPGTLKAGEAELLLRVYLS